MNPQPRTAAVLHGLLDWIDRADRAAQHGVSKPPVLRKDVTALFPEDEWWLTEFERRRKANPSTIDENLRSSDSSAEGSAMDSDLLTEPDEDFGHSSGQPDDAVAGNIPKEHQSHVQEHQMDMTKSSHCKSPSGEPRKKRIRLTNKQRMRLAGSTERDVAANASARAATTSNVSTSSHPRSPSSSPRLRTQFQGSNESSSVLPHAGSLVSSSSISMSRAHGDLGAASDVEIIAPPLIPALHDQHLLEEPAFNVADRLGYTLWSPAGNCMHECGLLNIGNTCRGNSLIQSLATGTRTQLVYTASEQMC